MASALESLAMVKREEWGAGLSPDWPASPNWPPTYHTPQFLVVHHTATYNRWRPLSGVRAIWRYHARTQGWGDIRYHYLIGQDGIIYEGRWRGGRSANIYVEGGQSMASNTNKVGIALLGQFEPSVPSPPPGEPNPEALSSLVVLMGAIAYDLDLDPLGEVHHPIEGKLYPTISGHRDHCLTVCPGGNLYSLLEAIRQQVAMEVQRLRESEGQVVNVSPEPTQVAWGKTVWPNLLWGDDDLYVGAWGDAVYYSLIEFRLPEDVANWQVTGLELSLTGQTAIYLRETTGTWQAVLLETPLRGETTETIPFEKLRTTAPVAGFLPRLSPGDLGPRLENRLSIDPADLEKVRRAAASGYLAIRLEGPTGGSRLFSWDSGYGRGGILIKPTLTIRYL
jgi:hypothetical protein